MKLHNWAEPGPRRPSHALRWKEQERETSWEEKKQNQGEKRCECHSPADGVYVPFIPRCVVSHFLLLGNVSPSLWLNCGSFFSHVNACVSGPVRGIIPFSRPNNYRPISSCSTRGPLELDGEGVSGCSCHLRLLGAVSPSLLRRRIKQTKCLWSEAF